MRLSVVSHLHDCLDPRQLAGTRQPKQQPSGLPARMARWRFMQNVAQTKGHQLHPVANGLWSLATLFGATWSWHQQPPLGALPEPELETWTVEHYIYFAKIPVMKYFDCRPPDLSIFFLLVRPGEGVCWRKRRPGGGGAVISGSTLLTSVPSFKFLALVIRTGGYKSVKVCLQSPIGPLAGENSAGNRWNPDLNILVGAKNAMFKFGGINWWSQQINQPTLSRLLHALISQRPVRSRSSQIVVGHNLNFWLQILPLTEHSRYLSDNAAAKLKEESSEQRDQRVRLQGAVITILVLLGLTLKICFHGVITDQEIFRPQDLSQLITFILNVLCWCWS